MLAPSFASLSVTGLDLEIGPRDLISQSEQDFRDPAHSDTPDSHEMNVLGPKKHSSHVLFRLSF